jgi:DNA modification methylase
MDWRHIDVVSDAIKGIYSELKNICVWNKTNAGMGSLYRSKHELVFVYKVGTAPHINNIELGRHGRYRTNVWDYAGINSFGRDRDSLLALHPTVKPVALIADAIKDCSKRGGIVLDPFGGSGTTLIAAEKTGRRAAVLEIDPLYVDAAVRRWQIITGRQAVLSATGRTFNEVTALRESERANALVPAAPMPFPEDDGARQ